MTIFSRYWRAIALMILFSATAQAQFNLDGQLIQRAEYRHGYSSLFEKRDEAAQFIGQRARLHAQYQTENFHFFVSIQDVRVWGNTPQVKLTDGFLSVHEAWAETSLGQNFSVKLGRQELNYDNFRFLGNLDWALQGRAHDFALLKYETGNMKLHAGGGYNQDLQRLEGSYYATPSQYKVAQFVRYENTWNKFRLSALFWNNGLQYGTTNINGVLVDKGIYYRQTFGLPTVNYVLGNTTLSGFYYQQLGEDGAGRDVQAFDASAQVSHLFLIDPESAKAFRITAGVELLSGNDTNATGKNRSFSPLYGTNHAHNGYMDLFYVGGRHENSVGLQDFFIRTRYDLNSALFLSVNGHSFSSYANVYRDGNKLDKHLGYEADFALGYVINNAVSLQTGYSQVFATETLEHLHNLQDPAAIQNWAYVMMIYRPTMKNRFIGLLF